MQSRAKFVLSKDVVLAKYMELQSCSDSVSYSWKTNPEVGRVLWEETECMFSVHSLKSARQIGPKRAWLFLQGCDGAEVNEALEYGIRSFVIDNVADLDVLLRVIDEKKAIIDLLLRMRLKEHTVHTGKHFVFGLYSHEMNRLVPQLRDHEHIDKLGIHVHRKTQNVSEWSLQEEFEQAVAPETLQAIDLVNIGGGLPAQYKNYRVEVLKGIFEKVEAMKAWLNDQNIKMVIEPGRYIAAPSVKLEAHIVNVHQNTIILDCSVFNAAMDTFLAHMRLLVDGEREQGTAYTIKGCTPDSLDIFRYHVFLDNPLVGDTMTFLNAGAYNFHTDFCGLEKLPTVIE